MPTEGWTSLPGWPYEVSNLGKVRNSSGKVIKPWRQTNGYISVDLHQDGIKRSFRVHRLVAEAFIPNPESKKEVNHIDGNKDNNAVSNLEWTTHQENMSHAFENGLRSRQQVFHCPMCGENLCMGEKA